MYHFLKKRIIFEVLNPNPLEDISPNAVLTKLMAADLNSKALRTVKPYKVVAVFPHS